MNTETKEVNGQMIAVKVYPYQPPKNKDWTVKSKDFRKNLHSVPKRVKKTTGSV